MGEARKKKLLLEMKKEVEDLERQIKYNKLVNLKNALIIALTYNTVIKKDEYETVMNIINALEIGGN